MKYIIFSLFAFLLFTSFSKMPKPIFEASLTISEEIGTTKSVEHLYNQLKSNSFSIPDIDCFSVAIEGFYKWKEKGHFKKNILTIIDFSLSSNSKRLWIIDLDRNEILLNTYVAHGKNTGDEFANYFSNRVESYQSSLGFYETAEIYHGKHGLSLKLDGLQKGLNDKARDRAVVLHGADYVSEKFIQHNKRLGRSLGCPAVPVDQNEKIISLIKENSCLFIFHPSLRISLFNHKFIKFFVKIIDVISENQFILSLQAVQ